MRTNIVINQALLEAAMQAGPFKTKREAVEAGLKLLARQAAYREILRWEGKLKWDDAVSEPQQGTSESSVVPATRSAARVPAPGRKHGRR
jgi:Arc/MetJ family transcription regulator